MTAPPLQHRLALVTGASRGIGEAVAVALARAGCDVALTYRERAHEARAVAATIGALGRRAEAFAVDVADRAALARLVADVTGRLGPIDVLVNNAGIGAKRPDVDAITDEDWDRHLAVNATSAFVLTRAVVPSMRARGWGRIINVGSVAAQNGGVVGPHYAATKGALVGLTHGYATRLARDGITVNLIAPALIATEMTAGTEPRMIPLGRFGEVEEIASVAVLLATNAYITGQTIGVNGGAYMTS